MPHSIPQSARRPAFDFGEYWGAFTPKLVTATASCARTASWPPSSSSIAVEKAKGLLDAEAPVVRP
jgi:hypothetical protein